LKFLAQVKCFVVDGLTWMQIVRFGWSRGWSQESPLDWMWPWLVRVLEVEAVQDGLWIDFEYNSM
jgi:hypothetical protein